MLENQTFFLRYPELHLNDIIELTLLYVKQVKSNALMLMQNRVRKNIMLTLYHAGEIC